MCSFVGCNSLIKYKEKYCEKHAHLENEKKKERHKHYDSHRKEDKEWKFYRSKEWLKVRQLILNHFNYIDIYTYFMDEKIIKANTCHHIIEIREDWSKRISLINLFPCSESSHAKIHKLYEKDKEGTQKLLNDLIKRWHKEVARGGGSEIV